MSIIKTSLQRVISQLQGLSLQERKDVAKATGVSVSLINQLRDGRSGNPRADTLDKLVDHFGETPRAASVGQVERGRELKLFNDEVTVGL